MAITYRGSILPHRRRKSIEFAAGLTDRSFDPTSKHFYPGRKELSGRIKKEIGQIMEEFRTGSWKDVRWKKALFK
jgi:hypothetical protein